MPFRKLLCEVLGLSLLCGVCAGYGKKPEQPGKSEKPKTTEKSLPPPDMKGTAAEEARDVVFSADKRTLVSAHAGKDGSVVIPDGVTTIGKRAFSGRGRQWLKRVTIPESVTRIESGAFAGCSELADVTIPAGVTHIGSGAFVGCGRVRVAPGNGRYYNDAAGALIDRQEKKLLHLPNGFSGAYTTPEEVTAIASNAFWSCKGLTAVKFSAAVTTLEPSALRACPKVELSPDNPNFYIDAHGALIDRKGKTLVFLPPAFSGVYTVPAGVTTVGEVMYCNLTGVNIPEGVTTIGDSAFRGCKRLTEVTIPASVTVIGPAAFSGCDKLESVTIPPSVKSVGKGAFRSCPCEEAVKQRFPARR